MASYTIAGFEPALPGSYERGNRERARQDAMISAAGGVARYFMGPRWRPDADRVGDRHHQHMHAEVMETTTTSL